MGRVQDIVVENFKSYQGRVLIGPFRHFTCVVGPNGAGKSNLMDAISFVLGVQARVLRSDKLRDLIYRKEGEDPKKNQRIASVELTYVSEDASGATPEVVAAREHQPTTLVFRRVIAKGGEARFLVNGETVTQAEYHKRLENINILTKVRNFLVFQGDVEAVAQRQGKDLTAFFEQISGSEAFRHEYDKLAAEKAKREDNARYLFTKKRNAINEKKRVSQQKTEADEYRDMEAERHALQREFYLFRLHGIARKQEECERGRARINEERQALKGELRAADNQIEVADRERAQAHLATSQAERALAAARAKLDRLNPERVSGQTRLTFLRQRIHDMRVHAEKDGRRREKLDAQAAALRDEEAQIVAAAEALSQRLAERELRFTPKQQKEFERAKRETERIVSVNSDRSRELEHQIRAVGAERTRVEHETQQARALRDHLEKKSAEMREAEEAARVAVARDSGRSQQSTHQLQRLRASVAEHADEKEQLQEERRNLLDTMQDMAATERQLQREHELVKVCGSLAAAVPGVHGRVIDLCRPSQKRLHVAVNVAMGKFLDAIVVDSGETARRCVRYLKEHMLPPMTFLPLSDLRVSRADHRLDELVSGRSTLRLGLNCVSFDERFARAFEFLLNDVVVADTMTDGRRLAFGDAPAAGAHCKVVTLAGEMISKNGNLSVNSDATREGATRFDLSELDISKSRLEAIDRRLVVIHTSETSATSEVVALTEETRRAEGKSSEAAARLQWCSNQLSRLADEFKSAEVALAGLEPEVERLHRDDAHLREEQRRLEEHMSQGVASHFARLNEEMGVEDVRKLEREWRREQEAGQARGDELARRLFNIRAELTMILQSLEEKVTYSEETEINLNAEIEELNEKQREIAQSIEAITAEQKRLQAGVRECADVERGRDVALSKLRQMFKDMRHEVLAMDKQTANLETEERQLCDCRTDLLRQSVLEDIEVPLLQGGFEALQDIAEAPSQPVSAPTQQGGPADARAAAVNVDFSSLPPEKQAASSGPASKMLEEEYAAELERLRGELERLTPNLKAAEQIQGVAEHVQAASHQADAARREIEDIDTQFEAVRKARKEKFMDCFQKVSSAISAIYQRLTANTAGLHADGGSAYLDLEDTEDPFNGGIKFTAMPPAKRFRDMHLLSGGEKTLAAMALLFAVHSFQRPPFMVLDEVDAALDANNVQALANYVEQSHCQTIVISLKDRFYIKAEALVGVWKNKPLETSDVLTLDLTRYSTGHPQ
eukprot:TRINITY_DN4094_c0_g1_i1.p1 TRINITY_DN4094_c0_g1~~TRINITY_DN4094_c0_g1_i1.p1  ORF type:complete len:1245 (-),score=280.69 TRINITY_DN4094_c0_g1_i1:271-4005(-)